MREGHREREREGREEERKGIGERGEREERGREGRVREREGDRARW